MGEKRLLKYPILLLLFFSSTIPSLWSQPMNDVCASAILIDETGMIEGSTLQATTDESGAVCNSLRVGTKGVWYKFMGTGEMITFSTCLTETVFDTWIAVYSGDCDALVCEAQNDNEGACTVTNASELDFIAEKGKIYYILIGGVGVNTVGNFKLATFCPGGGSDCIQKDECPDEDRITKAVCGCGKTDYSTDGERPNIIKYAPLTISHPTNDTTCLNGNAQFAITATAGAEEATLAYRWQVANPILSFEGGVTTFTDISDDGIYQGSQSNTLQIIKATQNLDELKYRVIVTQTLGNTNCIDTSMAATLRVFVAPVFTNHPKHQPICEGNDISFVATATASEGGTLSYQWQVSTNAELQFTDITNGELYSQATTNELKLTKIPLSHNTYQYRIIVKETIGSVICQDTSTAAQLTVLGNPIINRSAQQFTDICGDMIDLSGENTPNSTGNWTFASAIPENSATFSDPDKIATFVTGVYGGQYTLRWTVNSGVCQGRTVDLPISFNPDEDLPGGLPDGTQDCVDLCIGGDDRINTDGSGLPDACDCLPNDADNEFVSITAEAFQLFAQEHALLGLDTLFRKGDFALMTDAVIGAEIDDFPPVVFQAAQSITLTEGFHAKAGASFEAKIGFCRAPLAETAPSTLNEASNIVLPQQYDHQLHTNTAIQWEVFPTIVQQQAVMQLYLPKKNQITLALYDQHGRFIKTYLSSSQYGAGQHHFRLNTTNLVGGMYILRLVSGAEVLSQRIIVQ